MATRIILCPKCKEHKYQDGAYGEKLRVHNSVGKPKGTGKNVWRCTVCLNEKDV